MSKLTDAVINLLDEHARLERTLEAVRADRGRLALEIEALIKGAQVMRGADGTWFVVT